ncbi:hypothetical protein GCM10010913_14560 [Paenibacillus aceti]|uniref:Uncharacterized protein n=2 Tax=Paenibacillus aceti TaxID=1820010 RepID=A0ABQ1VS03_9BACL|nr:hypothetical protein [Paenibacillus aceti]GGF94132.1 hypothetical protein GCM10010913_14560 [Paenibacillus aceti]
MFDSEGLKEFDVEAFCIRISRVKSEIKGLLEEIIDFLMEYEWKEEVSFEKDDDKFMICANLYEDRENETITISLCLLLRISGFHPMGDIIFESEFNVEENELTISTENSDFNLDEEEIQIIFSDCWDEIRQYLLIEKEILEEIWEDE